MIVPESEYTPMLQSVSFHILEQPRKIGSIFLPDGSSAEEFSNAIAIVIDVGPTTKVLKRGDKIILQNRAPIAKVVYNGTTTYVANEDTILGVCKATTLDKCLPV